MMKSFLAASAMLVALCSAASAHEALEILRKAAATDDPYQLVLRHGLDRHTSAPRGGELTLRASPGTRLPTMGGGAT